MDCSTSQPISENAVVDSSSEHDGEMIMNTPPVDSNDERKLALHKFHYGCCPINTNREEARQMQLLHTQNHIIPGDHGRARRKQMRPKMAAGGSMPDPSRPFECTECDYKARTRGNLVVHMRVHTGARPYRCHICKKSFTQSSSVKTHMVVHYNTKPYKCDYPGCTFECRYKGNLTTHQRKHTGERPYRCDECGKCFSQHGGLFTHKKLHTAQMQDLKDTLHWVNYLDSMSSLNPPVSEPAPAPEPTPPPPPIMRQCVFPGIDIAE